MYIYLQQNLQGVRKFLVKIGSPHLYTGPSHISGPYLNGSVRVRVWIEKDMPMSVFSGSVNMDGMKELRIKYEEFLYGKGKPLYSCSSSWTLL